MKIVVCVKQVPDAKDVRLDPKTNTLAREGVEAIMNPYDRHALEEAVRLKEKFGGSVVALSMGPPQAGEMLREAVACGADEAVLVSDRAFAGADTWATSYTLAQAIKKIGFDLIICGKQAIDGDTAQVGPGLACRLDIPYVTCVRAVTGGDGENLELQRLMDDGYDELLMPLPGLFTVVREINEPRVPSLKGKMKAKKVEIKTLSGADIDADPACLGLAGSPTQVVKVFSPQFNRDKTMITGEVDAQVEELVAVLEKLV